MNERYIADYVAEGDIERVMEVFNRQQAELTALRDKVAVCVKALEWYAGTKCDLVDGRYTPNPVCPYDDGERARKALKAIHKTP
jgi:hypothetical protein